MKDFFFSYLFYLFFAYLLGSFPSGYLITRFSVKKNILEIGWRKTSGSNVIKNVGLWQGALTGILDILKGFLAVWLAQKFGFPFPVQVLSGVAAIVGHNWSLFLKFGGGRGVATFIGVMLAFSPKILFLSAISFLFFTIIFSSPIGTFFFVLTVFLLSFCFNQFLTSGLFAILSLVPILIKRLSPIKEILPIKEKKELIKNRLLFDNDKAVESKIKSFIKRKKGL